jgi:hypothetical protein
MNTDEDQANNAASFQVESLVCAAELSSGGAHGVTRPASLRIGLGAAAGSNFGMSVGELKRGKVRAAFYLCPSVAKNYGSHFDY